MKYSNKNKEEKDFGTKKKLIPHFACGFLCRA